MTEKPPRICVYCASHVGTDPAYATAATEVGRQLGHHEMDLVFGGGTVGLMGLVADAAVGAGRNVIGVITQQLSDKEIAHGGISDLRTVPDMPARKKMMYDEADAFLTLPGGIGTMEEFFEVLTWGYLGLHPKPMGLLNVSGYYDPLLRFLDQAIEQGLCRPVVKDHLIVGTEPATVIGSLIERLG